MKFTDLWGQNFLTLGTFHIKLDGRGLHLLQGVNDDNSSANSNGAGKSSIPDALSWVGYGITARGLKGDKVVNKSRKKDCFAAFRIVNGASTYVVTRYRKHAVHKNALRVEAELPTGNVDMTKGTDAETQKVVEQILGCSWEVFKSAVYSAQEDMPDLPRKTDKELKTLIEESAGLQRIERAYEIARGRKNEAEKALALAENTLTLTAASLARTEAQLDEAVKEAGEWEYARVSRVAEAEQKVKAATVALGIKIVDLKKRKPAYDAAVTERATIDQQLANHGHLDREAMAAEHLFHRANMAVNRNALQAAKKAVEDCEEQIANPEKYALQPCEACGAVGDDDDKEHFLEHKRQMLELLKKKLTDTTAAVTAQARAAAVAKTAAEAARAAVPDVTAATARRRELSEVVKAYETNRTAAAADKTALDELKELVTQRQTEANPHGRLVSSLQDTAAKLHGEVGAHTSARDAAKVKLQTLEDVCRVFGPAGVRAQILDTVTPFLNERTSDYLSALSDGTITAVWTTLSKAASGDLKEKFSIEVTDSQGGDSFDALSGGEKRKVRIACALALQDLVASRATQPIDLFIADEIDDALDPAGIERLMTVLERKARERGTLLVISHADLKDWIDEVTIVRKQGGISTVEGSLCS